MGRAKTAVSRAGDSSVAIRQRHCVVSVGGRSPVIGLIRATEGERAPNSSIATISPRIVPFMAGAVSLIAVAAACMVIFIPWQLCLPVALSGRDLVGIAQTGTGKTLVFGLAAVERIAQQNAKGSRVLVLVPTRELARQMGLDASARARAWQALFLGLRDQGLIKHPG